MSSLILALLITAVVLLVINHGIDFWAGRNGLDERELPTVAGRRATSAFAVASSTSFLIAMILSAFVPESSLAAPALLVTIVLFAADLALDCWRLTHGSLPDQA